MSVIEVREVTKRYKNGVVAVDRVSFIVEQGAAFGLLGPIGAGKSTIISTILGLTRPTTGTVEVFGRDASSQFREVQSKIGYLPERPGFYGDFSAEKNLKFLCNIAGLREEQEDKIAKIVRLVGLEKNQKTPVRTYSVGDRKRLGIAAAMLNQPELLILDEPSSGLDPQGRSDIMTLIHELNVHDVTLFIATHNVRDVAEVCEVVATIRSGHIAGTKATKDFVADLRGTTTQLEADVANLNERVLQALRSTKGVRSIQCEGLKITLEYRPGVNEDVNYAITRAGGRLRSLRESPSLEEAYVRNMEEETLE
ncbi:MAG TPA: ABC transporter ATP-binding protein [Candidatus Acidoferrales bacterium]|jgi:ABC-2 type transport system ATP-binding protein|nr:ABC transporter ATP-binding protein [Candidatus Acidoferrales bacterium]